MTPSRPKLETIFRFFISVPDGAPEQATPFQGFAYSLCENSGLLEFIRQMPSDVFELTPEYLPYRLARRIGGAAPVRWFGQSPSTLRSQQVPEEMSFSIIFLDKSETFADYVAWINSCPAQVTVVSSDGGHIRYADLSFETMRARLLSVCDILESRRNLDGVKEAKEAILAWEEMPKKKVPYELRGHGTILPNVAALRVAGYDIWNLGPLQNFRDEQAHVNQIVQTTNTVFDVRGGVPLSEANRFYPRSLDLNLYCPATYDLESSFDKGVVSDPKVRRSFRTAIQMLEKQSSYSFDIKSENQMKNLFGVDLEQIKMGETPKLNAVTFVRQREVWLGTEILACLASSEMSAVVRLPNRMNRTKGAVRQFAQHYRADRPQILKRAEIFRDVQRALSDAFPNEFYGLLGRSQDGIRIVADAHIEWLDVGGVPLGIRYNVSRIPVTPGNAFVSNIASAPFIMVEPDQLMDVIVISGLPEDDDLAKIFDTAFDHFGQHWRDKLRLTRVRVSSRQEFIAAVNDFQGMIMIFDSHGTHKPESPGVLWLNEAPIDVWSLRGEIHRAPPIVILSACDTHAADRNHATTANGFLALGTRSVLGSVFPLDASQAAIFTARLLYRVTDYVPVANKMFGRSLTWMEVVSGMLRRQLATDILRHLEQGGFVTCEIGTHNNVQRIVDSPRSDPFAEMRDFFIEMGLCADVLDREIHKAVASSSTISYLQLGRPETILIGSKDVVEIASA